MQTSRHDAIPQVLRLPYPRRNPWATTGGGFDTIICQVRTQLTINGARNPDLNCGAGSFVVPGDTPAFDWRTADVSFWLYAGPIRIHPASSGDAPCSEFDSTKAGRFEIHQVTEGTKDLLKKRQDYAHGICSFIRPAFCDHSFPTLMRIDE
ncbi:hypothetical protein H1R20_g12528, partial [Candolleomyces eurysporus]